MNRTELAVMGGVIGFVMSGAITAIIANGLPDDTRRNLQEAGSKTTQRLKLVAGAMIALLTLVGVLIGLAVPPIN